MANTNGNGGGAAMTLMNSDPAFKYALEPRNLDEAFKIATLYCKAGVCKTGEEALAKIVHGRQIGMPVAIAIQEVNLIEGRLSLSARGKRAVCLNHPELCEEFVVTESTEHVARCRVKRRGQPMKEFSFTLEQAQRAGLVKDKSAWQKWPERMLVARATGLAADTEFPDLVLGFGTTEEMEDDRIGVRPVPHPPNDGKTIDAEIVSATPPTVQPVVAMPARDYDAETEALKAEIAAASTKEQKAVVRKKIETFIADVGGPWGEACKRLYNTLHTAVAAKPADDAAPTQGTLPTGG